MMGMDRRFCPVSASRAERSSAPAARRRSPLIEMRTTLRSASTMFRAVVCVVGVWLALGVSAQAPTPAAAVATDSPNEPAAVGDEVIVRGRRMSDIKSDLRIEVDKFVTQVAAPPPERGYARWHRRVCVSVKNLELDPAQYLVDRISRLAADVGLEPGEPGCSPAVVILFSSDGKETARRLVDEHPGVLRPTSEGGMQLGLEAMHEFAESDKPVRWWQVSIPVEARSGTPAMRMPGEELSPGLNQLHWAVVEGAVADPLRDSRRLGVRADRRRRSQAQGKGDDLGAARRLSRFRLARPDRSLGATVGLRQHPESFRESEGVFRSHGLGPVVRSRALSVRPGTGPTHAEERARRRDGKREVDGDDCEAVARQTGRAASRSKEIPRIEMLAASAHVG